MSPWAPAWAKQAIQVLFSRKAFGRFVPVQVREASLHPAAEVPGWRKTSTRELPMLGCADASDEARTFRKPGVVCEAPRSQIHGFRKLHISASSSMTNVSKGPN